MDRTEKADFTGCRVGRKVEDDRGPSEGQRRHSCGIK